ncbi:DnaJ-class molecular chaperone with C-terminal Zn finger domain [Synechococcus sp. PCC 7502]|uniref:J domain-containing protein n=1 Tax=Synechococcus sp. PCC 7502 TaxID=1173263 RepID=UPI00029FF144|nr:J domain-containing protein [Synechococcus sp. PCC 7502]AFY75305.1 DnaJ-class molecular chaperone with C-terminal Zn finger domain [Synechococcus sp. PCC 7502]
MKKLQPFRIDQGICQFDFNDYYAALGVPITADAVTLRKRYLSIAKILHPDIYGRPPLEKHLATQYLAKLVNPAYHVLNQPLERTAYTAVLKLLGKRLMKKGQRINPQSEVARQLLYFPSDFSYEKAVQEVAEYQFQSLDTILEYSGQISELNLVYILYQEGYKHFSNSAPRPQGAGTPQTDNTFIQTTPPPPPSPPPMYPSYRSSNTGNLGNTGIYKPKTDIIYPPPTGGSSKSNKIDSQANTRLQQESQINQEPTKPKVSIQPYLKLAEDYIAKNQWSMARNELTKAEQIDNGSSKCYALLGLVYMNQKLMGLAKSNFQKALRLNPQEPLALKYINSLDASGKKDDPKGKDKPKSKKGGFFGWLSGN